MNIFSLFNKEKQEGNRNGNLEFNFSISGSDYRVVYADGENAIYRHHLGKYHRAYARYPKDPNDTMKVGRDWQEEENDVLTIKSETQYPGVYRCIYEKNRNKSIVFYIGLDFKKTFTDQRYIVFLYDLVLKAAKIFEGIYTAIDFRNIELINYTLGNISADDIGNYIGSIRIESDDSLALYQDEQIYEFSKNTPEMYELRQEIKLIEQKNDGEMQAEMLRLLAEITNKSAELMDLKKKYNDLAQKMGFSAYDDGENCKMM